MNETFIENRAFCVFLDGGSFVLLLHGTFVWERNSWYWEILKVKNWKT